MSAQATRADDTVAEAIDRAREEHIAAVNAGDAATWAAGFTPDGVQMPPGFEANVGREAIRSWCEGFLAPFDVQFSVAAHPAQMMGTDHALEEGTWEITLAFKGGAGEPIRDHGKYVSIYQRHGDEWLLSHDIWNTSVMPAG
jgi:uncharacterized protein (TIGR02246 family)